MTDAAPTFENALAAYNAGRPTAAAALCHDILRNEPNDVNALHLAGLIAYQSGDAPRAVALIGAALRIHPEMPQAYNTLAAALLSLKDYAGALHNSERALVLRPAFTEAHNNRGVALSEMGRFADALEAFARARAHNPDYILTHHNEGTALRQIHRHDAALENFARAIVLKPDYAESHWEAALTRLQMGDYTQGWRGYEWRWRTQSLGAAARVFPQPLWLGETPIANKTVLIHGEQGLGDTIQFCRYAKDLADMGARVVLEVQRPLAALLRGLEGTSDVIAQGDALPAFDLHCPLMSLPLAFGTTVETIPARDAYVRAPEDKVRAWRTKLGEKTRPRIGLVWSGNPDHRDDRNRSIPLRDFAAMLPEGLDYISLQTELRADDAAALADLAHIKRVDITDFGDTAALCALMDIVLTVDTSVAHLAGALGRPVWLLLSFTPDWRWLLEREDSPWYPSAKLYRQTLRGDWRSVFARVRGDLGRLLP
jgi:tetratricopeptide (TPR) repeat protein